MAYSNVNLLLALLTRFKACGRIVGRGLENRGRLAVLELEEAWTNLLRGAALLAAGIAAAAVTGTGLNILVAAIFWDTAYRIAALAAMAVLQLAGLGFLAWRINQRIRNGAFLEATRTQLAQDRAAFESMTAQLASHDDRAT